MAFGVANTSLPGRGPTPGLRFFFYAAVAITLMFADRRMGWMEQVRFGLSTATYPLQLAVSSPSAAWSWMRESVETRDNLRAQNSDLRTRLRDLELRTMRYEALARENATLRGLSTALPPVAEKWLVAEIVHVELDSLRPRVLINRGLSNGVFKAQAVLDDQGVVGQTTHVGLFSAEVILITDPEHAIPVQIERTGVRTIAVGTGIEGELALPYLPGNADVKEGDLLITSGMGGVFPQGYPVGKVTEVHREAVQPLAQVRAAPFAHIDRDREVMLVWFREAHPAAPVRDASGDLPKGDPNAQPQVAPPKPKPVQVEAPAGTAAGPAGTTPAAAPRSGTAAPRTGTPTTVPGQSGAGPRQTVPTPRPAAPASSTPAAPASTTPATPASPPPPAQAPAGTASTPPRPPENRE
jgi:rod shape-determining protein MreC